LLGNERSENHDYPDNQYRYFLLAERFGWTPSQVDNEPAVMLDWLLAIGNVVDEVKSEQMNK
jgi:hypothetical protein